MKRVYKPRIIKKLMETDYKPGDLISKMNESKKVEALKEKNFNTLPKKEKVSIMGLI